MTYDRLKGIMAWTALSAHFPNKDDAGLLISHRLRLPDAVALRACGRCHGSYVSQFLPMTVEGAVPTPWRLTPVAPMRAPGIVSFDPSHPDAISTPTPLATVAFRLLPDALADQFSTILSRAESTRDWLPES